jgi:hypothetical protein
MDPGTISLSYRLVCPLTRVLKVLGRCVPVRSIPYWGGGGGAEAGQLDAVHECAKFGFLRVAVVIIVPDRKFLDVASLGQSVPWLLCPSPNHPIRKYRFLIAF